ncbi:hypothetical protein VTL71DRAFT_9066 [Oculimacula yallundae]|uniref:Uncharacterized protein n=1 Tax=Oculimacula yallundae TaxID=86028 RepID=A0ABR4BTR6_9HELO
MHAQSSPLARTAKEVKPGYGQNLYFVLSHHTLRKQLTIDILYESHDHCLILPPASLPFPTASVAEIPYPPTQPHEHEQQSERHVRFEHQFTFMVPSPLPIELDPCSYFIFYGDKGD